MAKAKKVTAKKAKTGIYTEYSPDEKLAKIIGAKPTNRGKMMGKVWDYIKAKKLQSKKSGRIIIPDKTLAQVTGPKQFDMFKLAGHLNKHLK